MDWYVVCCDILDGRMNERDIDYISNNDQRDNMYMAATAMADVLRIRYKMEIDKNTLYNLLAEVRDEVLPSVFRSNYYQNTKIVDPDKSDGRWATFAVVVLTLLAVRISTRLGTMVKLSPNTPLTIMGMDRGLMENDWFSEIVDHTITHEEPQPQKQSSSGWSLRDGKDGNISTTPDWDKEPTHPWGVTTADWTKGSAKNNTNTNNPWGKKNTFTPAEWRDGYNNYLNAPNIITPVRTHAIPTQIYSTVDMSSDDEFTDDTYHKEIESRANKIYTRGEKPEPVFVGGRVWDDNMYGKYRKSYRYSDTWNIWWDSKTFTCEEEAVRVIRWHNDKMGNK